MPLTLSQLLADLPESPGAQQLPIASPADGLSYQANSMEWFVAPLLADRPNGTAARPSQAIIISAAGAVGKSTLASEIARARRAPLWDLALAQPVGQYSLQGLLQQGFGISAQAQIQQLITSGGFLLVIDALDEARVKATEGAFEAFIRDVASLARTSPSVSFVLLGRTQIAETTWLILEDCGLPTRLLTIQPFSPTQRAEYIEKRVRTLGGRGGALLQAHPGPFAKTRDLIVEHLERSVRAQAVNDDTVAQDFLGYAPVLDAIAVMLSHESNFVQAQTELSTGLRSAQPTHIEVLDRVVKRILEREREEKLVRNIKPVLAPVAAKAGWSDWGFLYSHDEQCARLAARILDVPAGLTIGLPSTLLPLYEDSVAAFLPEHAFLRDGRYPANAVFESYLLAYVLLSGPKAIAAAVETRLASSSYKPSRLFADFYLHLKSTATMHDIPAHHLGWLYDGMLSADSDSLHVSFSLDGVEGDGATSGNSVVEGEFEWAALRDDGSWHPVRDVPFRSSMAPTDSVNFGRYVRHASITIPSTVILGNNGAEYQIGPKVTITCNELRILAERLIVGGREHATTGTLDEDDAVVLEARSYFGTVGSRPQARVPFVVDWPGAERFPWNEFRGQRPAELSHDQRLHTAFRRFRRIATALRSHGKGSLARTQKKIENDRVMQGPIGFALLKMLVQDGILVLQNGFYHWVPDIAAAKVGISYEQLRRGQLSPKLTLYLRRLVDTNPTLFLNP